LEERLSRFFSSLNDGKEKADAEVAHSLYRRAMGEAVYSEKRFRDDNGEYEIIRLSQSVPSDPGAAKLWLTNRQKNRWRDKQEVEVSGPNGGAIPMSLDVSKLSSTALEELLAAQKAGDDGKA
jgi:hypothetical protein